MMKLKKKNAKGPFYRPMLPSDPRPRLPSGLSRATGRPNRPIWSLGSVDQVNVDPFKP